MTTSKDLPSTGAATALEIYNAVGFALTIWETAEDTLMGLFRYLCADREPIAFSAYVSSSRSRRIAMMKLALVRYKDRFKDTELDQVQGAMKALDNLASTRNEVAHGNCANYTGIGPSGVVMSGVYLMSSWNAGRFHERSQKYAHNLETINSFTTAVQEQRNLIRNILDAMMKRHQEADDNLDTETRQIISIATGIVAGSIPPELVSKVLKLSQST